MSVRETPEHDPDDHSSYCVRNPCADHGLTRSETNSPWRSELSSTNHASRGSTVVPMPRQARWDRVVGHRERLVAIAIKHGAQPHEAEDCAHDALVKAVERLDMSARSVRAWLTTVTVNLANDIHRGHEREARACARYGLPSEASPEDIALDRDEALRIAETLRLLSVAQRRAVASRALGFEPRETASAHGVSPKSVHQALFRCRRLLLGSSNRDPLG